MMDLVDFWCGAVVALVVLHRALVIRRDLIEPPQRVIDPTDWINRRHP
jgi:hypothetical protein